MPTMTMRLDETDAEVVRKYAEFEGKTISDFVRDAVFEKIEDQQDLATLREAIAADNGEYSDTALKQLKKMDRFDARLITSWIGKNLEGCSDPRIHGKGLTANRSGEWRYRIGNYRALCIIEDDRLIIEVFSVGHRRHIYQ